MMSLQSVPVQFSKAPENCRNANCIKLQEEATFGKLFMTSKVPFRSDAKRVRYALSLSVTRYSEFYSGNASARSSSVSAYRLLKTVGDVSGKVFYLTNTSSTSSHFKWKTSWHRTLSATLTKNHVTSSHVMRCLTGRYLSSYDKQDSSLYHKFVEHAVEKSSQHMVLSDIPMNPKYRELVAKDGDVITTSSTFQAEKVRQFRAAEINGGRSIQVLNLLAFPNTAYDFPIFCADLVKFSSKQVIVLDLNPLYSPHFQVTTWYKEKYITPISRLWKKYDELLPWGGELSSEAIDFFSPYVLWSKPSTTEQGIDDIVFSAFKDYFNAWLNMVDKAEATKCTDEIQRNREAQHRYMSWRFNKDPGRNLLTKLYGETLCEEYMKKFLFAGLETMGTKSFLDYFPAFRDQNGSIQKKRSMAGKAYSTRPWDENGNRER